MTGTCCVQTAPSSFGWLLTFVGEQWSKSGHKFSRHTVYVCAQGSSVAAEYASMLQSCTGKKILEW